MYFQFYGVSIGSFLLNVCLLRTQLLPKWFDKVLFYCCLKSMLSSYNKGTDLITASSSRSFHNSQNFRFRQTTSSTQAHADLNSVARYSVGLLVQHTWVFPWVQVPISTKNFFYYLGVNCIADSCISEKILARVHRAPSCFLNIAVFIYKLAYNIVTSTKRLPWNVQL